MGLEAHFRRAQSLGWNQLGSTGAHALAERLTNTSVLTDLMCVRAPGSPPARSLTADAVCQPARSDRKAR